MPPFLVQVIVSIVDLAVAGGGGFLKGVRILRAFRPLRIISRQNEGPKMTEDWGCSFLGKKKSTGWWYSIEKLGITIN